MRIVAERLAADAFSPFGDVLEPGANGSKRMTNMDFLERGLIRFPKGHETDSADILDAFDYWPAITVLADDPKASMLRAHPRPMEVRYYERHILGRQLMINLGPGPVVLVVAPPDAAGEAPERALAEVWQQSRAFILEVGDGVNLLPSVWHWPPFPVASEPALCFLVVRASAGLDDYTFSSIESVGGEVLHVEVHQ